MGQAVLGHGGAGPGTAALPCQSVTTASEGVAEEKPPLPGPRKKQAAALTHNIEWLAHAFGLGRVGFLTLTLGDWDAGGRYRNLRARKEAQRRFHSLLSNEIAKRYVCGVTITERHGNGGIHFHLAVVCGSDIRGAMDFAACFPPKAADGRPQRKPDYSTANVAIRREWAFWRRVAKQYGFGRHQLQPMRESGATLGGYLGAYLRKDWDQRWPEDKGARCVRYFGHWANIPRIKGRRRIAPPHNSRFGWMTPGAHVWREMVKQAVLVLNHKGADLTEANIKERVGPKWAWKMGKLFEAVRFEVGDWQAASVQATLGEHNSQVASRWRSAGGHPARSCWWQVAELTLDHLRPSPACKQRVAALLAAQLRDAQARQRRKAQQAAARAGAEQLEVLLEVAASFAREGRQP